jgi:Flp pilus assembly pilin Flp
MQLNLVIADDGDGRTHGDVVRREQSMFSTVDFVRAVAEARGQRRGDRGASLVEYALLLALIAVVCLAAVSAMGLELNDNYNESTTSIFGD